MKYQEIFRAKTSYLHTCNEHVIFTCEKVSVVMVTQ